MEMRSQRRLIVNAAAVISPGFVPYRILSPYCAFIDWKRSRAYRAIGAFVMQHVAYFDSVERQRAKQHAREQDDRDLQAGLVSPEALNQQNGFFSGIDFSNASIRRRRRLAA
ncbi:hypothetical protein [Sphingomonas sp. GB1N7]|uniref:hypothetical protein n=1 Tax=Parasphingomonas caseinilytica TaxID=3096158 RepID=UPI002FC76FF4